MFSREVIDAIKEHAKKDYPYESCGVVVNGAYRPCTNVADDPERDFRIPGNEMPLSGLEAIVHSHPGGPAHPTAADMAAQIKWQVPFGIAVLHNPEHVEEVFWWGGKEVPPLLRRTFRSGVTDCYSLIRDAFGLGKDGFAAQGVTSLWPFNPIQLRDQARDWAWWENGGNLYEECYAEYFKTVDDEYKPGDLALMKVLSDKYNHGVIYIGNGLILHHPHTKLSQREPAARFRGHIKLGLHLRYKDA